MLNCLIDLPFQFLSCNVYRVEVIPKHNGYPLSAWIVYVVTLRNRNSEYSITSTDNLRCSVVRGGFERFPCALPKINDVRISLHGQMLPLTFANHLQPSRKLSPCVDR